MKLSLIISVYNNIEFLALVLRSVNFQTYRDFEVIIAEDNNGKPMAEFLLMQSENYNFTIKHVWQEDRGFRKSKVLNKAVKESSGEFLVFIDGDCILHKNFLMEYAKRVQINTCLFGRRVMLSEKITNKLLRTKNYKLLSFRRLLFSGSSKVKDCIYFPFSVSYRRRGLKGCNFGLPKTLLEKINGFDEDYVEPWGGEDTDIERRLALLGAEFKSTKFNTIQFHLYHKPIPRGNPEGKNTFINSKKALKTYFCSNGLIKSKPLLEINKAASILF